MLIFRNSLCVVILHEIVFCLKQFVLAVFAIESNFAAILYGAFLVSKFKPPIQTFDPSIQIWNCLVQTFDPSISTFNPSVQIWNGSIQAYDPSIQI